MTPITRVEMFLAKAAGEDVTTPKPITRIEMFLQNLIDHIRTTGGGGSGKSAYEYAKDGGYTGTEEEFAAKLAEDFTADDALELLAEMGIVTPVTDENGAVFTDENGAIFTL